MFCFRWQRLTRWLWWQQMHARRSAVRGPAPVRPRLESLEDRPWVSLRQRSRIHECI